MNGVWCSENVVQRSTFCSEILCLCSVAVLLFGRGCLYVVGYFVRPQFVDPVLYGV